MPGLAMANRNICRDRGAYTDFSCLLFAHLRTKPNPKIIEKIITEAVEIEKEYYSNSLPVEKFGMDLKSIHTYIEFVADGLLQGFGNEKYYNAVNPFEFMEDVATAGKTTFFEKKVSDYQRPVTCLSPLPHPRKLTLMMTSKSTTGCVLLFLATFIYIYLYIPRYSITKLK